MTSRSPSEAVRILDRRRVRLATRALAAVLGLLCAGAAQGEKFALEARPPIALPGGEAGIDLDDLWYDAELDRLLVPAAATGRLDLVDPKHGRVSSAPDFGRSARSAGAPAAEVTSADAGGGLVLTSDGSEPRLVALGGKSLALVASAPLASPPDYLRYLAERREIWVTEPRTAAIEIFSLAPGSPPVLARLATVAVPGGPEALVFDAARGRAYSNLWQDRTVAIDLATRAVVADWSAGCAEPRGLAFDARNALLFVGCKDGTVAVLDVAHDGRVVTRATAGAGVDIIAFDPERRHLFVPGARAATLTLFSVGVAGDLHLLASAPTAEHAHCVVIDGRGGAWVCDPRHGRLLVFRDHAAASR